MSDGYPTPKPVVSGLNAEWYRFLAAGELRFQRCEGCGTWRHPPRVLCAACGSPRWDWRASSRRGAVYSWTITHRPLHPEFAAVLPYSILIVAMEEGPRIVCSARGIDNEELAIDLPVTIGIAPIDDDAALPFAEPVAAR